ncbi:MAG: hypothetical protein V1853_01455 [bacterium]
MPGEISTPPEARLSQETNNEKGPEQYANFWASLTIQEQQLAEALLNRQVPNSDTAYMEKDLDPEKVKHLTLVDLGSEFNAVATTITRGIGTSVRVEGSDEPVLVDKENWREYGPRGKWASDWMPHLESLKQKIEAFLV